MAGNLTKFEVAQFKEAFALFDTNKDGKLEPDEVKFVMSALGNLWIQNKKSMSLKKQNKTKRTRMYGPRD